MHAVEKVPNSAVVVPNSFHPGRLPGRYSVHSKQSLHVIFVQPVLFAHDTVHLQDALKVVWCPQYHGPQQHEAVFFEHVGCIKKIFPVSRLSFPQKICIDTGIEEIARLEAEKHAADKE